MSSVRVRSLITQYLGKSVLMQVATVNEHKPWVCSVYFAYDDQLSLYWISHRGRRHSKELKANPFVSGAIVLPHVPGDDVQGIQFEGTASELNTTTDFHIGMSYYAKRFSMPEERITAIRNGSDGHVCYKITPTSYVLFDEVHFPNDARQEYIMQNI